MNISKFLLVASAFPVVLLVMITVSGMVVEESFTMGAFFMSFVMLALSFLAHVRGVNRIDDNE